MPSPARTVLAPLALLAVFVSTLPGEERPAVFEYLAQRAARMGAALPPLAKDAKAWEQQRGELVKRLSDTLGLPAREPMRAALLDRREQGDLVFEEVAYLWAEHAYVSATVVRAKQSQGQRPGVVIPPGWLGHHTFRPYRPLVERLARAGYVVLAIDDPRTGRRQAPYAGLYAAASAAGTPIMGVQVFDALRGLDYLATRPDVHAAAVGIAGLEEGAIQAMLAAAVEPRFQFVVAVGGVTTYEALLASIAAGGPMPEDPSVYVPGLLSFADLDRVAACLAPRPAVFVCGPDGPLCPASGQARFAATVKAAYRLADAADRLEWMQAAGAGEPDRRAVRIVEWIEVHCKALKSSAAPPQAVLAPDEAAPPDFSMLRYFQRRIEARAKALQTHAGESAEKAFADQAAWLRRACALDTLKPGADKVVSTEEKDGLTVERLLLGIDEGLFCPATLYRPAASGAEKAHAVLLSHDARQSGASPKIVESARKLALSGCWVVVPEHASPEAQAGQPLLTQGETSFYGDQFARLYGPADCAGLAPLALRVAEDLAAVRHLAARAEVDGARIVAAGIGIGGLDVCLAAVLEPRVAGVGAIGATTVRDWVQSAAPEEQRFLHLMPYLPGIADNADFDLLIGAVAPRPLVLVRPKDGWPRSGFEEAATTVEAIYQRRGAAAAVSVFGPRDLTPEREAAAPEGLPRRLAAAARVLMPAPPTPGLVGNVQGLKGRATVDSAQGLVWLVAEMDGYEQEFAADGWRLASWAFFNDNGAAQKGRLLTPLLFKKEGDAYKLIGVGKARANEGTGAQRFDFEPVDGTDAIGEDCFFGFHDGGPEGENAGVAEFEDAPDCRMVILAPGGPKLKAGTAYRVQTQYPRRYSVMAEAKKP